MLCEHCCGGYTAEGEDMPMEVFRAALDSGHSEYITLGGGEPTLNSRFEKMLLEAICHPYIAEQGVFIITNGKIKKRALMLANLAKKKVIGAQLSQDIWHDPVDDEVVKAFANLDNGFRDVSRSVIAQGRAKENDLSSNDYDCVCDDPIIMPDGNVKACGCPNAAILGNTLDGWDYYKYDDEENHIHLNDSRCWTSFKKELAKVKEEEMLIA
jgi:hypothetical protein